MFTAPRRLLFLPRLVVCAFLLFGNLWLFAVDFTELETAIRAELQRNQVPGCAVAVVDQGKLVFAKGFGVANVESGEPVRAEMLFRLGSTTKMFTAAGLVLLAEDGKVDLRKPVGDYVKDLHPSIARLTSHQLLTHTAGLADPNAMNGPHDETALAATVRALGPRDFFDEPGRIYSYANPGYWIAGFVAQEVSGKLYADHLDERIFKPLRMTRTTFRPTVAMTWPFAVGHSPEGRDEAKVIRPLADNAGVWPAGQLFSSAPEFARFCIAFMNGGMLDGKQVLSRRVIEELSTPHVAVPMDERLYGYGLSVRDEAGLRWLSHTGSRTGYGSIAKMCPEKQFAVIILCNKTGHNLPRSTAKAVELVLGIEPEREATRTAIAMTPEEMQRYAGTYSSGRATARLQVRDGNLIGAQGGVIRKVAENRFIRGASGALPEMPFSLLTNGTGEITHMLQRGRAMKRVAGP